MSFYFSFDTEQTHRANNPHGEHQGSCHETRTILGGGSQERGEFCEYEDCCYGRCQLIRKRARRGQRQERYDIWRERSIWANHVLFISSDCIVAHINLFVHICSKRVIHDESSHLLPARWQVLQSAARCCAIPFGFRPSHPKLCTPIIYLNNKDVG